MKGNKINIVFLFIRLFQVKEILKLCQGVQAMKLRTNIDTIGN